MNMFSDLRNCTKLYLNWNRISKIESRSFNGLSNLDKLYLKSNRLHTLQGDMFKGLKVLQLLALSSNRLRIISDDAFIHIDSIHELYLHFNDLTRLPEQAFSHLPRPLQLSLLKFRSNSTIENPMVCDLKLCWLKQEELQGNITWYRMIEPMQGLFVPFARVGSGDPVRVLRLFHNKYAGYT